MLCSTVRAPRSLLERTQHIDVLSGLMTIHVPFTPPSDASSSLLQPLLVLRVQPVLERLQSRCRVDLEGFLDGLCPFLAARADGALEGDSAASQSCVLRLSKRTILRRSIMII